MEKYEVIKQVYSEKFQVVTMRNSRLLNSSELTAQVVATTLSRAHTPFLLLFLSLGVVQLVAGKDLYALEAFLESFAEFLLENSSSLYTFGAIVNCTLRL